MAVILVVEDDESIRTLLELTLENDYEVHVAADGSAGLEAIERIRPNLVILDVMMPGLDGWAVLKGMREKGLGADTRVIMLTARVAERDFVSGWHLGVAEYMTKPFDPDGLLKTVRQTLASSDEEIIEQQKRELDKTNLLSRIETAFGEGID